MNKVNFYLIETIYALKEQGSRRCMWIWPRERVLDRTRTLCGDFNQVDDEKYLQCLKLNSIPWVQQ